MSNNVETTVFRARARLKELRVAHHDLDTSIHELSTDPNIDLLKIKRLKKQKLRIKDMIVRIESQLIPDLNA
ncbi:MAG: YdcH family protein [Gammaproteobacteria bacterium]|nr:YdcH family protein [Gammaproteobacteria bacterium]